MNLDKIKEEMTNIVSECELKLYKLEFENTPDGQVLRVTVDKKEPMSMDDISLVTEKINLYLDETDPIESEYSLEVTSRGIEKEFNDDEINDFLNEYIFVKTLNEEFYGTLKGRENQYLLVKNNKNKIIKIDLNDVTLMRTAVKF